MSYDIQHVVQRLSGDRYRVQFAGYAACDQVIVRCAELDNPGQPVEPLPPQWPPAPKPFQSFDLAKLKKKPQKHQRRCLALAKTAHSLLTLHLSSPWIDTNRVDWFKARLATVTSMRDQLQQLSLGSSSQSTQVYIDTYTWASNLTPLPPRSGTHPDYHEAYRHGVMGDLLEVLSGLSEHRQWAAVEKHDWPAPMQHFDLASQALTGSSDGLVLLDKQDEKRYDMIARMTQIVVGATDLLRGQDADEIGYLAGIVFVSSKNKLKPAVPANMIFNSLEICRDVADVLAQFPDLQALGELVTPLHAETRYRAEDFADRQAPNGESETYRVAHARFGHLKTDQTRTSLVDRASHRPPFKREEPCLELTEDLRDFLGHFSSGGIAGVRLLLGILMEMNGRPGAVSEKDYNPDIFYDNAMGMRRLLDLQRRWTTLEDGTCYAHASVTRLAQTAFLCLAISPLTASPSYLSLILACAQFTSWLDLVNGAGGEQKVCYTANARALHLMCALSSSSLMCSAVKHHARESRSRRGDELAMDASAMESMRRGLAEAGFTCDIKSCSARLEQIYDHDSQAWLRYEDDAAEVGLMPGTKAREYRAEGAILQEVFPGDPPRKVAFDCPDALHKYGYHEQLSICALLVRRFVHRRCRDTAGKVGGSATATG